MEVSGQDSLTLRVEILYANSGRDDSSLHSQNHFHHTSHSTGGFGVADVGLHGSNQERVPLAVLQEQIGDTVQLDWVADGGTSSVALKVGRIVGAEVSSELVRCTRGGFLADRAGLCNTTGLAVCVDSSASDDTSNWVTVADGVREPLQVQRSNTFSPTISVG